MKIIGVIPARFGSSRFPGKPLELIGGISMIQRVYNQCKKSKSLLDVIVATDDQRIFDHVTSFGGKVIMTSDKHENGTERCGEVLSKLSHKPDYIINIQGDEPFIHPEQIDILSEALIEKPQLATLVKKIEDAETLFNTNTPKVLLNKTQEAIYFSRQTIPYLRDIDSREWLNHHVFYKHIGIYAYRCDILTDILKLETGTLEQVEKLEQLRWIENGFKIKAGITTFESFGIDTKEDLLKAEKHLKSKGY